MFGAIAIFHPCPYSFAASEVMRLNAFKLDCPQVRHWALRTRTPILANENYAIISLDFAEALRYTMEVSAVGKNVGLKHATLIRAPHPISCGSAESCPFM